MPQRHYLDTSAQIERHGGEAAVRRELRDILAGTTHATSTHVAREWRHIIHGSATRVLNACQDAESVTDVKARLRQGYGRQPGHNSLALDLIGGDSASVVELELAAETFLRTIADALFEVDIDEIRDGSACMLARERPVQDLQSGEWSLRTSCRRHECVCNQIALTDANVGPIAASVEALRGSPQSGHKKMARIAAEAMAANDKTRRKGKACFGGNGLGGDISIALECADDEVLLTTDASFDHICPAVGVAHRKVMGTRTP